MKNVLNFKCILFIFLFCMSCNTNNSSLNMNSSDFDKKDKKGDKQNDINDEEVEKNDINHKKEDKKNDINHKKEIEDNNKDEKESSSYIDYKFNLNNDKQNKVENKTFTGIISSEMYLNTEFIKCNFEKAVFIGDFIGIKFTKCKFKLNKIMKNNKSKEKVEFNKCHFEEYVEMLMPYSSITNCEFGKNINFICPFSSISSCEFGKNKNISLSCLNSKFYKCTFKDGFKTFSNMNGCKFDTCKLSS